ncbi:MAG: CHRD domain-containing protein [Gammaproteobacteria bacterium]
MKSISLVGSLGMLLVASGVAYGDDGFVFTADLGGTQEILGQPPFLAPQPGIETGTAGRFRIRFDRALTTAQFRLRVDQGVAITQAHLHCAPAGVNGPIAVFLFDLVPDPGVDVNGLLSEGELTNANFQAGVDCNATCGKTVNNIASLQAAMRDGCIYANVHSVANPGGEVRGQVRPKEDD